VSLALSFDPAEEGVTKAAMSEQPTSFDRSRPIEEWSDDELLEEFRYIKAELADEDPEYRDGDGAPADVIEEEMRRRGLEPDREDVIPDADSPGREDEEPRVRG
jgi:hypothetical protein